MRAAQTEGESFRETLSPTRFAGAPSQRGPFAGCVTFYFAVTSHWTV